MGRLYSSVAEAIAEKSECTFALPFPGFKIPLPKLPPSIPLPFILFGPPPIPVYCPLD